MPSLTIGEIARRTGLRPSAIRYYERLGILPEPQRVNGRRRYAPDVVHLIGAIGVAKQAGLTMVEMQQLFQTRHEQSAPSVIWEQLAQRKLADVSALIRRAEEMKLLLQTALQCGCLG